MPAVVTLFAVAVVSLLITRVATRVTTVATLIIGRQRIAQRGLHGVALAVRPPAPILAERLGFHQARTAQWVRAAGATYADSSPCATAGSNSQSPAGT